MSIALARAARYAAAVGSDDRGRNVNVQNGQADQAPVRPDARSEVCHFDGKLRQLRRTFSARLLGL